MDATKLEGLGTLVDEVDAAAPPSPEEAARMAQQAQAQAQAAQAEQTLESEARQWGSIAYMIGGALGIVAPELRQVYTERACMDWGRAVVPVAAKYGWNGAGHLPELGLAIATLGLAVPSVLAVRAAMQREKAGWLGAVRTWWAGRKGAKPATEEAPEDGR